jgi:hypothetical protein
MAQVIQDPWCVRGVLHLGTSYGFHLLEDFGKFMKSQYSVLSSKPFPFRDQAAWMLERRGSSVKGIP